MYVYGLAEGDDGIDGIGLVTTSRMHWQLDASKSSQSGCGLIPRFCILQFELFTVCHFLNKGSG